MNVPSALRKWLAFGSGVGIEIGGPAGAESLRITAVRVHPGKARVLDSITIADAQHHAAGTWGSQCAAFLRKLGLSHTPAAVLLPRRDVTVRQIAMPGVSDKDLASAIEFQMDGLHPYPESDALASWMRLPGSSSVLVAITRRSTVERLVTLFAEAGLKIGSFTCSAAALYSARRMFGSVQNSAGVIAAESGESSVEIYGESAARPVFSAVYDVEPERAIAMAASEMRLEPGTRAGTFEELIGMAPALPFVAALASACPILAPSLNLLPEANRIRSARRAWIPIGALAAVVAALAAAYAAEPGYDKQRYLKSLNAEIARVQPAANRSAALDRDIEDARRRILLLDQIRTRSKADMDVLAEMTRILPPPTWVNSLEVGREQVTVIGETPQAAPLLQAIDSSPLFEKSEFVQPPTRLAAGEAFRIRTQREAGK